MGYVQSNKYQPYCPNCNSNENVIEIVYGYPTKEGMEDYKNGLKHLGPDHVQVFWKHKCFGNISVLET